MSIYEPQEDSFLLQKVLKEYAFGRVLDMGTGSGIQALTAMRFPNVREVVAVDINPEAIAVLKEKVKAEKIRKVTVLAGDLFEQVSGQFNLILFNPPYLPQDKGILDTALYGGKKGWEISARFFEEVSSYLFPEGIILFLFSSHTNKKKIDEILTHHLFEFKEVAQEKMAFEQLYVYEIKKSTLLRVLEKRGIHHIGYHAKGKRGFVYSGMLDKTIFVKKAIPTQKDSTRVAIKVEREDSTAINRIANEVKWLEIVNKESIGPKLLYAGEQYFVMEFVTGVFIEEFISKAHCESAHKVLLHILKQCFILDMMGVSKEEMHHPVKNIIVDSLGQPTLIDFERCTLTEKPQNVTQFVEFICRLSLGLKKKGWAFDVHLLREAAKDYKVEFNKECFDALVRLLKVC
jgi:release factor glutamine methyltransferase